MKLIVNYKQGIPGLLANFSTNLQEANKIWLKNNNLIITLASSGLLLNVAIISKIFPQIDNINIYFILASISFFITIFLGVINNLIMAFFFKKLALDSQKELKKYIKKISEGTEQGEETLPEGKWCKEYCLWIGISSIICFFLSVILICLGFIFR